jgi:hypothetical protein
MYIEIENEQTVDREISSRKTGQLFYTREQNALMFVEGSKYPHHFQIRLAFEQDQAKRNGVGPIAKGKYALTDEAFYIDRFGAVSVNIEAKTLKLLPASGGLFGDKKVA